MKATTSKTQTSASTLAPVSAPAAARREVEDPSTSFARAELYGHRIASPPSAGQPLPGPIQRVMERSMGADFSSVRVHEGPHVEQLGAAAYTRGERIHFAPGQYRPHSREGRQMLGHELAHVVQQRQGRVARGAANAINADPQLEAEADQLGARAASASPHS